MRIIPKVRTIPLLLLSAALSACSYMPWSKDEKPKPLELAPITQSAVTLKKLWQTDVGDAKPYVLTPAVIGNSVYAATAEDGLRRLDGGKEVWRTRVEGRISGGVGSDGKLVVIGTPKGEVQAYDTANGKLLWKTATGTEVLAAPVVTGDLVIVRGNDARIQAFDAANGKRRWIYQRSTPSLTLRSSVGVIVTPNGAAAGFPGGKLVMISLANGTQVWEATVAQPKGSTELERMADITSSPVVAGSNICAVTVGGVGGKVACFALASGTQQWARDVSSIGGLDADDKAVYVSNDTGAVLAFDISNGFNLWKQDKLVNRELSRPIAMGEVVFVGDSTGTVHALKRDSGAFAARVSIAKTAIRAEPQRMGKSVVVQAQSGEVAALSAE